MLFRKFEREYFLFLRGLPSFTSALVDDFCQDFRIGSHITSARTSLIILVLVKVPELAAGAEIVLVLVALSPERFALLVPEITSRTEAALTGIMVASETWLVRLFAIISGRTETPAAVV